MSQLHKGSLDSIKIKIDEMLAEKGQLNEITKCIDKNQENILKIQKNIGKKDAIYGPMAYPK
jgi:hypothetical protein